MFERILIANRAEIAVRIIRACRELGISTVAVYSKADANSYHVKLADEAICVGGASSTESYLRIPNIIAAAEIADVEAIHPGYGFLAENDHFAEVCRSCNIKFIGPPPEIINLLGDKNQARITAKKAGIPIIPGSDGLINTREEAVEIAKKLGYPIIIKASAGGGGKGMRIAHNDVSLASAFQTAQQEAQNAFGNGDVYIEKFIEDPRHVEIQIMADEHGNCVYLGERECSIQRKHQKMIEETPSPIINAKLRAKLGKAAVKLASSVGYQNAGTVEFLVDKHENFYFMELNARIQVEHPITETVTGIDLIKEQLRVASGKTLSFSQNDIKPEGVAIECRINAENPEKNFMPSAGTLEKFILPGGPGVRIDTHAYQGYKLSPYYDSMLAKIICYAPTRKEALNKMYNVLGETVIEGIHTTIPFLRRILTNEKFVSGKYTTHFVDELLAADK